MNNVHPNTSIKGYKLPFGLKMKPISHKFSHGQVKFQVKQGDIHYTILLTEKSQKRPLFKGVIADKDQLAYLTTIKEFPILASRLGIKPLAEQPIREAVRY